MFDEPAVSPVIDIVTDWELELDWLKVTYCFSVPDWELEPEVLVELVHLLMDFIYWGLLYPLCVILAVAVVEPVTDILIPKDA